MPDSNAEKSTYSGFERLLFFLTPILFTAVLLGVLLLLFNSDWRHSALKIGHKVPLLSSVLPQEDSKTEDTAPNVDAITVSNARQKVDELNAQLLNQQAALQQEKSKTTEQAKTIDDLKSQIESLSKQNQDQTVTTEAYDARIRSLSDMYSKMTPSKAAPILEQMTVEEATLVLGSMTEANRARVMEKMTPKTAAEVTTRLKDANTVRDQELAALQSRIDELQKQATTNATTLDTTELKTTFGSMQPKKAATLLLQMATTNPSKTLLILGVLDDSARSQVLSAMSDENSKVTAQLVGKLMPANP